MAYLQSMHSQILLLLCGVGSGFLLGIVYELFRFLRLLFSPKRSGALWDAACGAVTGIGVFLFLLVYDDGRLRAYVLLSLCAGFAVCYTLCAASLRRAADRFLHVLRRVSSHVSALLGRMDRLAAQGSAAVRKKLQKNLKKTAKK